MKFFIVFQTLLLISYSVFCDDSSEENSYIAETCCSAGETFAVTSPSVQQCSSIQLPEDVEKEDEKVCKKELKRCCESLFKQKSDCSAGVKLAPQKRCSVPKTDIGKTCCEECSFGKWTGESQGQEACGEPPADDVSPTTAIRKKAYYQCCLKAAEIPETTTAKIETTTKKKTTTSTTTSTTTTTTQKPKQKCKEKSCDQLCNDEGGAIICQCFSGYRLAADKKTCIDINECGESLDDLCTADGTVCHNTPGAFKCVPIQKRDVGLSCPPGFKRNVENQVCDDINECQLPRPPCPKYLCKNTVGAYTCAGKPGQPFKEEEVAPQPEAAAPPKNDICPPGFRSGPDDDCIDIDECAEHLDDCQPLSQYCINTNGNFFCQDHVSKRCAPGFKVNALTGICEDIDECEESELCKPTEVCVNLPGAYNCKSKISTLPKLTGKICQEGTRLRGGICEDIDECREGTHLCDQFQNCINTFGGHECRCKPGYSLDPTGSCVDIDECALKLDECPPGTYCNNILGSFTCAKTPPSRSSSTSTSTTTTTAAYEYDYYSEEDPNPDPTNNKPTTTTSSTTTIPTPRPLPPFPGDNPPTSRRPLPSIPSRTTSTPSPPRTSRPLPAYPGPTVPPTTPPNTNAYWTTTTTRTPSNPDEYPRTTTPKPRTPYNPRRPLTTTSTTPSDGLPHVSSITTEKIFDPYMHCLNGFEKAANGECIDVDECLSGRHICSSLERCVNKQGGYICHCIAGYRRDRSGWCTVDVNFSISTTSTTTSTTTAFPTPRPYPPYSGGYPAPTPRRQSPSIPRTSRPLPAPSTTSTTTTPLPSTTSTTTSTTTTTPPSTSSTTTSTTTTTPSTTSTTSTTEASTTDIDGGPSLTVATHILTPPVPYPPHRGYNYPGTCEMGYEFDPSRGRCVDIDECATNKAECKPGEECENIPGGYQCICGLRCRYPSSDGDDTPTYILPPRVPSNPNVVTVGSQYGRKGAMYEQPSFTREYTGEIVTACPWGYTLTPDRMCLDNDECAKNISECGPMQRCENFFGGYSCQCPSGYQLDGPDNCVDIDECYYGQPCPHNAQCMNTQGSYRCRCGDGFRNAPSNEKVCVDLDECTEDPGLCEQGCANSWGGYRCYCQPGYRLSGDNRTCTDIDECEEWGSSRHQRLCGGHCVNDPGSYHCTCPSGYRLNEASKNCVDIDECATGEATCGNELNDVCQNTHGSFHCYQIQCPPGYRIDANHYCRRVQRTCLRGDMDCLKLPSSYAYNFITFVANIFLPEGRVNLFTMHGPGWNDAETNFEIRMINVETGRGVTPAQLSCFDLQESRRSCRIGLRCSLEGPQVIELELKMTLLRRNRFAGTVAARLIVIVSQYEF